MKRKSLNKTCKHTLLAVPAAALMLGASQGATIGINYTVNWAGNNPNGTNRTAMYIYNYMTTGMNVTATAFGVPASSWNNIQLPYYSKTTNTTTVGPLTVVTRANGGEWSISGPGAQGLGNTNTPAYGATNAYLPAIVIPGNDEVTWSYLDDDVRKSTQTPVYILWNVQISGLRAAYPSGYTVQTIGVPLTLPAPNVNLTDFTTFTNALIYTNIAGPGTFCDTAISQVSPVLTNDSITIYPDPPVGSKNHKPIHHSTLAGFIIGDAGTNTSSPLTLSISGNNIVWTNGTLQSSAGLGTSANWTNVAGATSPYPILPSSAPQKYYRLKQ